MTTYTTITSLSRKVDRRQFISDLGEAIRPTGLAEELEVTERDDNTCLNAIGTSLSAQVWFLHRSRYEEVPLIAWHGAQADLQYLPAAWQSRNDFHFRKATSFPETLDELIGMLVVGLGAAQDGSAFSKQRELEP